MSVTKARAILVAVSYARSTNLFWFCLPGGAPRRMMFLSRRKFAVGPSRIFGSKSEYNLEGHPPQSISHCWNVDFSESWCKDFSG
jgi:hypothetical protein